MATGKRTKASSVTAGDIEGCFEKYLGQCSTRDLNELLVKPMAMCTWKTAPANDMPVMLKNASLYEELLKAAPTGVLPPAATRTAIENLNYSDKVNMTSKPLSVFADAVS